MPATQLGAMPQVQLDSLPLMTAQAAASGGTVSLGMAGGITRFWDSTALGITAANFAGDANGMIVLLSNFIAVFGCRSFSLLFTRTNVGVGVGLQNIEVRVQYRLSAADVPPTSFGAVTQDLLQTGSVTVHPGGNPIQFPPMQAAGQVQRALVGWDNGELSQATSTGTPAMIGDNVRLFFNMGLPGNNPGVANVFTAQLWGTS